MSAPRLILKQPTGWFAAGREFAQAMTLLSDGAFKLYVHLCLSAKRHTACLATSINHVARAMNKTPERIHAELSELEHSAVCALIRKEDTNLILEICDRFWPYEKQRHPEHASSSESEFVEKVRALFLAPACVQASFSAADERIAADLHHRGISLEQVARAILLGCARKYVSMINAKVSMPITSLQYFSDVIEEIMESAIPDSYWEPLRSKVARMEQQWREAKT